MGSHGHAFARLKRALATENLTLVRAAAAELPGPLPVAEALEIVALMARQEPDVYERAAARFAARATLEDPDIELPELALLVAVLSEPGADLLARVRATLRAP